MSISQDTWGDVTSKVRDLIAENEKLKNDVRQLRAVNQSYERMRQANPLPRDLDEAKQALSIIGIEPEIPVTTETPITGSLKWKAYRLKEQIDAMKRALDPPKGQGGRFGDTDYG